MRMPVPPVFLYLAGLGWGLTHPPTSRSLPISRPCVQHHPVGGGEPEQQRYTRPAPLGRRPVWHPGGGRCPAAHAARRRQAVSAPPEAQLILNLLDECSEGWPAGCAALLLCFLGPITCLPPFSDCNSWRLVPCCASLLACVTHRPYLITSIPTNVHKIFSWPTSQTYGLTSIPFLYWGQLLHQQLSSVVSWSSNETFCIGCRQPLPSHAPCFHAPFCNVLHPTCKGYILPVACHDKGPFACSPPGRPAAAGGTGPAGAMGTLLLPGAPLPPPLCCAAKRASRADTPGSAGGTMPDITPLTTCRSLNATLCRVCGGGSESGYRPGGGVTKGHAGVAAGTGGAVISAPKRS